MRASFLLVPTVLAGLLLTGARAAADPRVDVEGALAWLRSRQAADGGWREKGDVSDPGLTARCLLAHQAAGHTHHGGHESADSVRRGLRYLERLQAEDGRIGTDWGDHAWATLAMLEGYGMTGSPLLKGAAVPGWQRLVRAVQEDPSFATDARLAAVVLLCRADVVLLNREWARRRPRAPPERRPFPPNAGADAVLARWMHAVTGESPLRRSVAVLARILFDRTEWAEARLEADAAWLEAHPPAWEAGKGNADPLAWWVGAVAAIELRGTTYRTWRKAAYGFAAHQARGAEAGSWNPVDPAGHDGGRLGLTATILRTFLILTPCYSLPDPLRDDG